MLIVEKQKKTQPMPKLYTFDESNNIVRLDHYLYYVMQTSPKKPISYNDQDGNKKYLTYDLFEITKEKTILFPNPPDQLNKDQIYNLNLLTDSNDDFLLPFTLRNVNVEKDQYYKYELMPNCPVCDLDLTETGSVCITFTDSNGEISYISTYADKDLIAVDLQKIIYNGLACAVICQKCSKNKIDLEPNVIKNVITIKTTIKPWGT